MIFPAFSRRFCTPQVLVPVIVMVALGLGSLWFLNNFEKKPVEINQGKSPAVRKNPLLAAERYLQAVGKPVKSQQGIDFFTNLPSAGDAVVVRRLPGGLSREIKDGLLAWVEAGGHLLLVPNPISSDNPGTESLLERLGVRVQGSEDSSDCGCPTKENKENSKKATSGQPKPTIKKELVKPEVDKKAKKNGYHPFDRIIDLNIAGFPIKLQYFGGALLEDINNSADFTIEGSFRREYTAEVDRARNENPEVIEGEGAWLLQYQRGAGTVTVLSEITLFDNDQIKKRDHAFFLSWLVGNADKVVLLYASSMDALPIILWHRLPFFLISLAILLILAVWKLQKRSGERQNLNDDRQRNILAHVDATGQFGWRMDKAASMIQENRRTILQELARRKLGVRLEQENIDMPASLAAKSGISEHDLHNAFSLPVASEQNLIQMSRALQKIQILIQGGDTN